MELDIKRFIDGKHFALASSSLIVNIMDGTYSNDSR